MSPPLPVFSLLSAGHNRLANLLVLFSPLNHLGGFRFLLSLFICLIICLGSTPLIGSTAYTSAPASEAALFSHPEQIAHLSGEGQACHQMLKYFQPVSGQWSLAATDLSVKGAEPLAFQRVLLSPHIQESYDKKVNWDRFRLYEQMARPGNGWTFLPEQFIKIDVQPKGRVMCYVTDANGMTFGFRLEPATKTFVLEMDAHGMNNGTQGLPSSHYDCRNSTLHFDSLGYVVFTTPEGVQRFYKFPPHIDGSSPKEVKGRLEKTRLRNGSVVRYVYGNQQDPLQQYQLTHIASLDPTETHVYAVLAFSQTYSAQPSQPGSFKIDCTTVCQSNTGAQATWKEEVFSERIHLSRKIKFGKDTWDFTLPFVRLLRSSSSPQNGDSSFYYTSRFLCSDLNVKEGNLRAEYGAFGHGEKRHYRIKTLLKQNAEGVYKPLYHFDYTLAEAGKTGGSTHVKLLDGSSIVYKINEKLLLDSIAWKDASGKVCKEERFVWNAQQWCERKELYADNKLVRAHAYSYDARGNPILEETSGDLTGTGTLAKNSIRRTYSQDALALLLSEERGNGRIDRYRYLPGTDLLQSHFVCHTLENKEQICQRTFFVYNAQHQLVEKRIDDGSSMQLECIDGVTECHITCWKLRQQAPFLHLPEEKIEYVLDQGKQCCVARSCYTYDAEGNLAIEAHYDGQGQLLDTLTREYNAQGNVVAETNNLGQKATYTYDSYGRKTGEIPFSADRKIEWTWDNQGRCISKMITGFDGLETRYTYTYDHYDALIDEKGSLGEGTKRDYSSLFGQLTHEKKPSTLSLNGTGHPVSSHYTYDGAGRLIVQTDANGSVTKTHYTAYGKPHTILHADGTTEHFQYALDGNLERYTDREGLQTHYKRDIWERVLAKSYIDEQGNMLAQETWEYNAFHLLRKTDREGHITQYAYDAQGRKIQKEATPRCTRWKYDARGDIKEIIYVSEDKGTCTSLHVCFQRDALGRVIETHSKDHQGNLLKWEGISYDLAGRVANQECLRDGKRVVESFTYDSQDRLLCHQDCNGALTTTHHAERTHVVDGKAQRIETKQVTFPEGEVTEIGYDHAGREWLSDQWDATGRKLVSKENEYDAEGNLLYHREWFYDEVGKPTLHTVAHTYTQDHLVASSTRAAGSAQERTTKYMYSPEGRLLTREDPSGRTIHYTYDGLGYVRSIKSSDQTVDQHLEVNRLGHLLKSVDGTTGLQLVRTVDRFGSVLAESFPCGKHVSRHYDARGRLQELNVTGLGSVRYSHDSLFLRAVEKFSPQGERVALHRYTEYDQDGCLNQELLAGGLGSLNYRRDAKGRLLEMHTPHGSVSHVFDAQDRLINRTEDGLGLTDKNTPISTSYTYDGLSQLLSEQPDQHIQEGAETQSYQYDMQGSRLTKNGAPSVINLLCEELSSGTHQYAYDLDGNRIEKAHLQSGDTWTYTYNALHQCTEAYSTTCRVQFAYDALHRKSRRILEQRADTSKDWTEIDRLYFLYQGLEEIGSYRETGECTSYRVLAYPENSVVPRTIYMELEGNWYVPQSDTQGSITHLLDPRTAAIASLKRHTAFGEVLAAGLPNGFLGSSSETSVISPWSYFSKRIDPNLGLIDFGKRWYDPQQARWTALDPAGFVDGTNLYRFVRNNPWLYNDPDGQMAFVIPIIQGGAWLTAEAALYFAGTAVLSYGAYKTCQYMDRSFNDMKTRNYLRGYHEGWWTDPLCSTNLMDYKPTRGTEEEEKRSGRHGSNRGERKVGIRNESVNSGVNLNEKLGHLEQMQQIAVRIKKLSDGRIRYYKKERASKTPGRTRGGNYVAEYNPATGRLKGWNECYDQMGNTNVVHPKNINGQKVSAPHYYPLTAGEIIK